MPDSSSHLVIRLLGTPQIQRNDRGVEISRIQIRALLYRLATRLTPIPRAHLAYLFWPDVADTVAARRLTNCLSHLRRALGEPNVLERSPETVQLMPELVWSDTDYLLKLIDNKRLGGGASDDVLAAPELLDLYRGSFLEGVVLPGSSEFNNWIAVEQTRFEQIYLQALQDCMAHSVAVGDLQNAAMLGERYLGVDDLAEEIYRQLMRVYGLLGDRASVQRTFERCVASLQDDLAVDPLPSTVAIYSAALAAPENLISAGAGSAPHASAAEIAVAPPKVPGEFPLVGRAGSLQVLQRAHREAASGSGRFVLVCGEQGIGKSRLVRDFLKTLPEGWVLLSGACMPAGRLPYQPLLQALRGAFAAGALPEKVPLPLLGDAARVLPEIQTWFPALPQPAASEPIHERMRLYMALEQLVVGYSAEGRTTVLVLEDLQWIDSALLDWLIYLAPKLSTNPLLILGTHTVSEQPPMQRLRDVLEHCGVLLHCSLAPLSQADVEQIVQGIGEGNATPTLVQRLHALSGGNPLFLWEIARSVDEDGRSLSSVLDSPLADRPVSDAPAETDDRPWLSSRLHEVVRQRIHAVSPLALQLLQVAAVLGRSFDRFLLEEVSGRSDDETIDGLEQLVDRLLLVEDGTLYKFQHEVVRGVVYAELSQGRRQLLHGRVAEVMSRRYRDQTRSVARRGQRAGGTIPQYAGLDYPIAPGLLAHHLRRSGQDGRAVSYLLSASKDAFAQLAMRETIAFVEEGLEIVAHLPPTPSRDRYVVELWVLLGKAKVVTHGPGAAEVRHAFEQARNRIRQMQTIDGLFPVLIGLAVYYFTAADLDTANSLCAKMYSLVDSNASSEHILACNTLRGLIHYFRGEMAEALDAFDQADANYDADRHGYLAAVYGFDPILFSLCYGAGVHVLCDRIERGFAFLDRALALTEANRQPYLKNMVHYYHAIVYQHLREPRQALQHAEIVLKNAREQIYPSQTVLATLVRGWARAMQGEAAAGLEELRQAISLLQAAGVAIGLPLYLSMLAEAHLRVGQFEEAHRAVAEGLTLVQERGERFWQSELERLQGDLFCLDRTDRRSASLWYRRAIATARAAGATLLEQRALASLAQLNGGETVS